MTETETPAAARTEYRNDIQGLRAIAVVLVILGHAGFAKFAGGFIGVDVFFVISGFVITQLVVRQPSESVVKNIRQFYKRRVLRIVPAATLVLIATVIVAYKLLAENFDPQLLTDARWASLFAANWEMIRTSSDYFSTGVPPSLVTHFWSLAVEEQFYFLYPLIVFSIMRAVPHDRRLAVLRGLLITVIVASGMWGVHAHSVNPVAAYYSSFTRFWELGIGGLVALSPIKRVQVSKAAHSGIGVVALVAILWSAMNFDPATMNLSVWMVLPVVATAALIQSGSQSFITSFIGAQPMRYLGNISYSLYLWHFIWLKLPLQMPLDELPSNVVLIGIVGALACAVMSFHVLENPIRHSQKLAANGWAVVALLVALIGMTWLAAGWIEHLYNAANGF